MRQLLLLLPVLSLVACDAEPEVAALSPAQVDELMLIDNLGNLAVLFGIELCNDHVDNDGDQLVDGEDPDCRVPIGGRLGFIGETVEGTNIHGNPLDRTRIRTLTGSATVSYDPGSVKRGVPAELFFVDDQTRERTAIHLSSGAQADFVMSAQMEGDRHPGLIIGLVEGGGYYAPGPIGDTMFVEKR